jgi:hypothetical protein
MQTPAPCGEHKFWSYVSLMPIVWVSCHGTAPMLPGSSQAAGDTLHSGQHTGTGSCEMISICPQCKEVMTTSNLSAGAGTRP